MTSSQLGMLSSASTVEEAPESELEEVEAEDRFEFFPESRFHERFAKRLSLEPTEYSLNYPAPMCIRSDDLAPAILKTADKLQHLRPTYLDVIRQKEYRLTKKLCIFIVSSPLFHWVATKIDARWFQSIRDRFVPYGCVTPCLSCGGTLERNFCKACRWHGGECPLRHATMDDFGQDMDVEVLKDLFDKGALDAFISMMLFLPPAAYRTYFTYSISDKCQDCKFGVISSRLKCCTFCGVPGVKLSSPEERLYNLRRLTNTIWK